MVYVDNMEAPYRGMLMCHMVADTRIELLEMVDAIGVQRKWIQDFGSKREHFDICKQKKEQAIKLGAKEITMRELATMTSNRDWAAYVVGVENSGVIRKESIVTVARFDYDINIKDE